MTPTTSAIRTLRIGLCLAAAAALLGCASSGDKAGTTSGTNTATTPSSGGAPTLGVRKFKADDGRTIDIGPSSASNGGWRFNNPHMEKGQCWIADGFRFTGYDTLYVAPTLSVAKFNQSNAEEVMVHKLALERLALELAEYARRQGLFATVVTRESDIQPGSRTLRLENTLTEFTKGGGAARYFVGLYGGGQPVLRVRGKATEGDQTLFTFEARRSGVSADARLGGVFMKDEDIQIQDIRSLVLDLTDFMGAVGGKFTPAR